MSQQHLDQGCQTHSGSGTKCFLQFLTFKINQVDRIKRPSGPVLAHGPYVGHP